MEGMAYTKSIRNILMILLIIAIFSVLQTLSHLLIPLALAGLLTMLNLPLVSFLEKRKVPRFLITLIVASLSFIVLRVVAGMIKGVIEQIIQDRDVLAQQLRQRIDAAIAWFGGIVPSVDIDAVLSEFNRMLSPGNIAAMIGTLFGKVISSFGSSLLLFLLYYLFLLSGATGFRAYREYVVGPDSSGKKKELSEQTQKSISTYMAMKTLLSLLTGILVGLICWAFGLQFAFFWGFIAYIMNYIPSIGSIAATVFPALMAIIQFDSLGTVTALLAGLTIVQITVGNIIDPMLMGNRLRFNTVSILFFLLFWGYIWGIPGMLLAVPFMVITRLLLERHDEFAILARLMGYPDKPPRKRLRLLSRIVARRKK